jgi:uncharacterized protein (TIGR00730 family)
MTFTPRVLAPIPPLTKALVRPYLMIMKDNNRRTENLRENGDSPATARDTFGSPILPPCYDYEVDGLAKEEAWRMFLIMGEFVQGFEALSGLEPSVSIYGSARNLRPNNPVYRTTREIAFRLGTLGYSVVTGGGPGVMEAANRGAAEAGARSVGLNINLPDEQKSNHFATQVLTFRYFFVRKVMLVKYASAFIFMPGGLGTMDEMTEVLTLMQTRKIRPFPVILYGREYWKGFLGWLEDTVIKQGFLSEDDFKLLRVCDNVDEVVEAVQQWKRARTLGGHKAVPPMAEQNHAKAKRLPH